VDKKEDETNLQYIERVLQALMKHPDIQGVTIGIKTRTGMELFTCVGNSPHFKLLEEDDWNDYWG
jgi:hypothetical protein